MRRYKITYFLLGPSLAALLAFAGCGGNKVEQSAPETAGHSEGDGHNHGSGVVPAEGAVTAAADWCAEHRVPESVCTRCNASLIAGFKERGDWCAEHDLPESHCRLCNPGIVFAQEPLSAAIIDPPLEVSIFFPENAVDCATNGALIEFASTETASRAGLSTVAAVLSPPSPTLEAPAEVHFDETRMTVLTSTVSLTVTRWLVEPGARVQAGTALAEVLSPEVATLRGDYLSAHAQWQAEEAEYKRMQSLHAANLSSASELETSAAHAGSARAEVNRLRGLLINAGVPEESLAPLVETGSISATFFLRAPTDGVLVERNAAPGTLVPAGQSLGIVADPSSLWVEARVRDRDLEFIRAGQRLEFADDDLAGERTAGTITWVSQYVDDATRTGLVRAVVNPTDSHLRPGEFGRALIYTQTGIENVLVPRDAVQWEGCCNVVFVQESDSRYRPRKVHVARGESGYYRITDGLKPGERVVVDGSFLLKTELKKSSIGAGCCGIEPVS
ncbi:MAG: efflux RND transporter periplasmic adaptor subunit [Candidatus Zixiibacteriota bacterium]